MFYRWAYIRGGAYKWGAYIRDVNWLTYLGAYIRWGGGGEGGGVFIVGSINRILWYFIFITIVSRFTQKKNNKIIEKVWS